MRYLQEEWGKPVPASSEQGSVQVLDNVTCSGDDYGYADDIFLVSILRDDGGEVESIFMIDTITGQPSKETLLMIRDQIDHQIAEHT